MSVSIHRVVPMSADVFRFVIDVDGRSGTVVLARAGSGQRAYRQVGEWTVSYVGANADAGRRAADWLVEVIGERGAEFIAALATEPGECEAPHTIRIDGAGEWGRRLEAVSNGERIRLVTTGEMSPQGLIGAWDQAVRRARGHGLLLEGVPRCLGGPAVAAAQEVEGPHCASCLDAGSCSGPGPLPPPYLRPRRSLDPMGDIMAVLGELGDLSGHAVRALAAFNAVVPPEERQEAPFEISWKIRDDEIVEAPRITWYEPRRSLPRNVAIGLVTSFAPSCERRARLIDAISSLSDDVTVAVGFAETSRGIALKLYVTLSEGEPAKRSALAFFGTLGRFRSVDDWLNRSIITLGVTMWPKGDWRVRMYEAVPSDRVSDDPHADTMGSVTWDLSEDEPPRATAVFAHYRRAHLSWREVAAKCDLSPPLADRIERALEASGARIYFTYLGWGQGTRTVYAMIGPRVREIPAEAGW